MYKKRKRSGAVDMDALTQDITRKVYVNIMQMLTAQGIEITILAEASPGTAGNISCASKEVDQKVVAIMTEPDTIDLLEGPTPCSLVIRPGGYLIKVARGQVLSVICILHTVLICAISWLRWAWYIVIPPITYYSSPPPNEEFTTLDEALRQKIQWKMDDIVVSSASQFG